MLNTSLYMLGKLRPFLRKPFNNVSPLLKPKFVVLL